MCHFVLFFKMDDSLFMYRQKNFKLKYIYYL
jgi:hypothetical protein